MKTPRTETAVLVAALRILERDIQSGDGVANAAIAEAADRLAELEREVAALRDAIEESEEFARKNGETCGSKIRELLRENSALREDSKIVDELCAIHGCGREFLMVWCRAAAYAQKEYTRKEAQP